MEPSRFAELSREQLEKYVVQLEKSRAQERKYMQEQFEALKEQFRRQKKRTAKHRARAQAIKEAWEVDTEKENDVVHSEPKENMCSDQAADSELAAMTAKYEAAVEAKVALVDYNRTLRQRNERLQAQLEELQEQIGQAQ